MVVITLMFSRQLDTEAATVLINTKESGLTSQPIWGQGGGGYRDNGRRGTKERETEEERWGKKGRRKSRDLVEGFSKRGAKIKKCSMLR